MKQEIGSGGEQKQLEEGAEKPPIRAVPSEEGAENRQG
jgi:hypothetical protein